VQLSLTPSQIKRLAGEIEASWKLIAETGFGLLLVVWQINLPGQEIREDRRPPHRPRHSPRQIQQHLCDQERLLIIS